MSSSVMLLINKVQVHKFKFKYLTMLYLFTTDNRYGLCEQSGRGIRWLYNGTRPWWSTYCISYATSWRCCCCPSVLIRRCRRAPSIGPSAHRRGRSCTWPATNVPSPCIWGHGNAAPNGTGAFIWGSSRSSSNGPDACIWSSWPRPRSDVPGASTWNCRRSTSNGSDAFWSWGLRRVSVCQSYSRWTREREPTGIYLTPYDGRQGDLDTACHLKKSTFASVTKQFFVQRVIVKF